MAEEQSLQAPEARSSKRARRSLGTRCIVWAAWGSGLGVVASIAAYLGGWVGVFIFSILPAAFFLFVGTVHLALTVVFVLLRSPDVRESLPLLFGPLTFSAVALLGGLVAAPRISAWQVESMKSSAVAMVEQHRRRTGHYPASIDGPEGLPARVSYWRSWDERSFTLFVPDRFSSLGQGWRLEAGAKTWTYGYDSEDRDFAD